MLSIGIVTSGGVGYYLSTVGSGVDDYYARTEPGRWIGAGAAVLGLAGIVHPDQVDALAEGRHPVTGDPLGMRAGKVVAFDLTFSSPKSVSVLGELGDPTVRAEVAAAHRAAVDAALAFAESEGVLVGRRGAGGARQVATAGAVAAAFEHRTSRAGDPQTHTHVLLFNRAAGVDGRWGGVHGRRQFAWAKTTGFVYQAALRAELTDRLGVRWHPPVHGTAEIAGVPQAVLDTFSTRRTQIESALAAGGHTSARAAQVATLAIRPTKPEPLEPAQQRDQWADQAKQAGLRPDTLTSAVGHPPEARPADPARLFHPDALTEHRSHFDRRDIIQGLADRATAGAHPPEVTAAADRLIADATIVRLGAEHPLAGTRYTTAEMLRLEAQVLDLAERARAGGHPTCPPGTVDAVIAARPTLSDEQQRMVRHLTESPDGVAVVIGRAGTGKSYALEACRAAWTASGIPVAGAALAAHTAAGLQAGTGIPSTTVDQLLTDLARPGLDGVLPRRGILVLDEAGLVGTRKLAALLAAAERRHTGVVLVGDPRQLPEVDAGGAFAALAARGAVELTANRRQVHEWERRALAELRHGDVAKAVTVYRDHGRITLAPTGDDARRQLVDDWWAARDPGQPDRAVMIALHQADVDDLNRRARDRLDAAGQLGPRRLEAAGRVFAVGDAVVALRNDRRLGITNGTRGTVIGLDPLTRSVAVETGPDRVVELPDRYLDAGHLTHGYSLTAHKAQGMTVGHAFVLGTDRLYREAGYTSLSRATDRTDLYHVAPPPPGWAPAGADPHDALTATLSRSAAQTLATDLGPARPDRLVDLRDAALADPGPHLIDRLGPPPVAGDARDPWAAAATAIDGYRQTYRITGPDPLGPLPDPARDPDQARAYDHAEILAHQIDRYHELGLHTDLGLDR